MPNNNTEEMKPLPQTSAVKQSGLNRFLSTLFGWRRNTGKTKTDTNLEFTKVDTASKQRIGQALVNDLAVPTGPMNEKLEQLFNHWLTDTTDKFAEIQDRKARIDQLQYMVQTDPFVARTVDLYADEATQLDSQDTIINIETPNPRMTKDMYALLNQWGITQNRIRATIKQLAIYGDAFWANKVSDRGVERIIPLQQLDVTDRIEFNPVKVLELKKKRDGSFANFAGNNYLIDQMLQSMEDTGDFADMFDTKLFGFSIQQDLIVPPWSITHFRIDGDCSEFSPWGSSPIIGALSPFKQTQSTIALQAMARIMSFPTQIYKVKTSESMDEGRQFATVNKVRESFDNIGVSPTAGSSEVYTVNTRIWVPDGLLSVETIESKVDTDNIDDIELHQNRTAVALGLPRSFFGEEGWYSGVGSSGKALMQQYKPFARKVYSVQSAFLDSLADLFRIHFAITGQYDFRTPFTISLKFPAEEIEDDKNTARQNSIEMAQTVIDLVKGSIGLGEDDSLPPDIVRDILAKYTFIDPTDIYKWTRDAKYMKDNASVEGEDGDGKGGSNIDIDIDNGGGSDLGGDIGGGDLDLDAGEDTGGDKGEDTGGDEIALEKLMKSNKLEAERLREKALIHNYNEVKDDLYFQVLKESSIDSFVRKNQHVKVFKEVPSNIDLMLNTLSMNGKPSKKKLRERNESFKQSFASFVPKSEEK